MKLLYAIFFVTFSYQFNSTTSFIYVKPKLYILDRGALRVPTMTYGLRNYSGLFMCYRKKTQIPSILYPPIPLTINRATWPLTYINRPWNLYSNKIVDEATTSRSYFAEPKRGSNFDGNSKNKVTFAPQNPQIEYRRNFMATTSLKSISVPSSTPAVSITDINENNIEQNNQINNLDIASIQSTTKAEQQGQTENENFNETFLATLADFDTKFFNASFTALTAGLPEWRQRDGVSFVQSGLMVYIALLALSNSTSEPGLRNGTTEIMKSIMSSLPESNSQLKFRRSTRLVLDPDTILPSSFTEELAPALGIKSEYFNRTRDLAEVTNFLNLMVEEESEGALRDTFSPEEVAAGGVRDVLLSVLYFRSRWRRAPTLRNGTAPFHLHSPPPLAAASSPMFTVNDHIFYADLPEWEAEAIEVSYNVEGLSLLMLVPRGAESVRAVAARYAAAGGLARALGGMRRLRAAVTLPLYTLRMTLLLPNKIRQIGFSEMFPVEVDTNAARSDVQFTQAVQTIMFWSEAGRNAFKDDGIQWDETPDMDIVVNKPYIFFVRWRNITLFSGNFAL